MITCTAPRTIVVVDDDVLVLDLLEQAVVQCGFEVSPAAGEAEAMDLLAHMSPEQLAGLVTDIDLGRGSGWEVARWARLIDPGLPVVYVTGDSGHEWDAQGVPGSVLMMKPLTCAQLAEALAVAHGQGV